MPKWTEIAYELPSGEFESIVLDASTRQQHDAASEVTTHPVEEGSDIADHVRRALDRVTIEGWITNTPIRIPESAIGNPNVGFDGAEGVVETVDLDVPSPPTQLNLSGLVGAGLNALFPAPTTAAVLKFSQDFDRVRAVDQRIRDLMDSGTPVLILTSLRDYEQMQIVSYSAPRDATTGDALQFVIEAVEVRVVTTEEVAAPPETRPRRRRGARQGTEATEGAGENASVTLRALREHAPGVLSTLGLH